MKNRILALVLILAMSVTLVPMTLIAGAASDIPSIDLSDDFWGPDEIPGSGSTGSTGSTTGGTTTGNTSVGNNKTEPEVEADEEEKTEEEVKEPVYIDFPDVVEADWFYNDVRTLTGMGIMNGYPDGSFLPKGDITRAEFLKLIVTLLLGDKLFESEGKMFDDVDPNEWYADHVVSAIMLGLISTEEYGTNLNPNEAITRREVAKIVVRALEAETGKYKTPYVDADDANITALYSMCIMQGDVDKATGDRYFFPDTQITRAEAATVLVRIYKYSLDAAAYIEEFKSAHVVSELEVLKAPETETQFNNELTNAWDNSQAFLLYEYEIGMGDDKLREIKEACFEGFHIATEHYPEYATHLTLNVEFSGTNKKTQMTLHFGSSQEAISYEELCKNRLFAKAKAKSIANEIGKNSKTDLEKANAVHDYLCDNVVYDDNLSPVSYTAYGSLVKGQAVCQGYAAAFNEICRELGVKALAVANKNHMWNVVLSEGVIYHYDATFDDQSNGILDTYRGIPESKFEKDADHGDYTLPKVELFK